MFKYIKWMPYILYGLIGAILYCIPVTFFLGKANFSEAWLLYLGNLLFCIIIALFLFHFNNTRKQNAGTLAMLVAGHIATVIGIVISCLFCFILLVIYVPDIFQPGVTDKVLKHAPANTIEDKTSGLAFMIFANAIVGNFSAGFFVSIVFPFSLKGDQTKEKVPGKQAEL